MKRPEHPPMASMATTARSRPARPLVTDEPITDVLTFATLTVTSRVFLALAFAMLGVAALLVSADARAGEIELEVPVSGWRATDTGGHFVQDVHYPATRVNVPEGTPLAVQIRGRIAAAAPKAGREDRPDRPATAIINGLAMPLQTDEDGRFARPYAFAAGSNSVEIRAAGRPPRRVQFVDASTQSRPRLRILLSWDSAGTDVDLHVITPTGAHAWYGHRVLEDGGALDVDVTDGYGPEIFATPTPASGTWHVYVNYFGAGADVSALSTAQVVVIDGEGTAAETRREFRVPLRSTGDLQHVVSFGVL